jgi:hypothetical protein
MKKEPSAMVLEANFDIDQDSNLLEWYYERSDGDGNPIEGRDAGSIYFTVGEKFFVQVKGGSKVLFEGFDILDCSLVSNPMIYRCAPGERTVYALPSPFLPRVPGAVMPATVQLLPSQFATGLVKPTKDYYQITQNWNDSLTVGETTARWDMAFYLTVRIRRTDRAPELRVFWFDPETTVGTGIQPP